MHAGRSFQIAIAQRPRARSDWHGCRSRRTFLASLISSLATRSCLTRLNFFGSCQATVETVNVQSGDIHSTVEFSALGVCPWGSVVASGEHALPHQRVRHTLRVSLRLPLPSAALQQDRHLNPRRRLTTAFGRAQRRLPTADWEASTFRTRKMRSSTDSLPRLLASSAAVRIIVTTKSTSTSCQRSIRI